MPAEVFEHFHRSRRPCDINGRRVRPMESRHLKGVPLSIQKGQAETFFLLDGSGGIWILKKFHNGRNLDRGYLETVPKLLPAHPALLSGTQREVLSCQSIRRTPGCHYSQQLAQWLDGTLLMVRADGVDWAAVADQLRDRTLVLDRAQRLALCKGLSEVVLLLEQCQIAHRDLSSGNVFIDLRNWTVILIDFDSLYHPSLPMPQATTCGTVGYAPPHAWNQGVLDAGTSWCAGADRYALALLNAEFLVLGAGAPLSAEGGIFDQDELRARSGKSIDLARGVLATEFPSVLPLFDAAIRSTSFATCPSPQEWLNACGCPQVKPPSLADIDEVEQDYFQRILDSRRPPAPLWAPPRLDDLPEPAFLPPVVPFHIVPLPSDPWSAS